MVDAVDNSQTQFDLNEFDTGGLPPEVESLAKYFSESDAIGLDSALGDMLEGLSGGKLAPGAASAGEISEKMMELVDILDEPGVMKNFLEPGQSPEEFFKSLTENVSEEVRPQVEELSNDVLDIMPANLRDDAAALVGGVANRSFARDEEANLQQSAGNWGNDVIGEMTGGDPSVIAGPNMLPTSHPGADSETPVHENGVAQLKEGTAQELIDTIEAGNPEVAEALSPLIDKTEEAIENGDKQTEDTLAQLLLQMAMDSIKDSEGSGTDEKGKPKSGSSRSGGGGGGSGSIFEVIAAALGEVAKEKLGDLREKADAVAGAEGEELAQASAELNAASQEFQLINTTVQTTFNGLSSVKNAAQGR